MCVYKCIILGLWLWVIMGAVLPLSFSALSEPNFHADIGLLFLNAVLSASLPMTVPYWWPITVFAWKLWPTLVRHCEDAVRYPLLKGWWEHFVPQVDWCWGVKNGFTFEFSLTDAEYRLSSNFAAFREVLKVVGDLVHLISSSKIPQFLSLTNCRLGTVINQNCLSNSMKVWNLREDTVNSAINSLYNKISFYYNNLFIIKFSLPSPSLPTSPFSEVLFCDIFVCFLLLLESGKMVLLQDLLECWIPFAFYSREVAVDLKPEFFMNNWLNHLNL